MALYIETLSHDPITSPAWASPSWGVLWRCAGSLSEAVAANGPAPWHNVNDHQALLFEKGRNHLKWTVSSTKNCYLFFYFSDRPFNSYDSLKLKFCLIKPPLSWKDLAHRRIPIWNPVRRELCIQIAHCRIPGILTPISIGILNAHILLRLVS
jgi:hypothetical protein